MKSKIKKQPFTGRANGDIAEVVAVPPPLDLIRASEIASSTGNSQHVEAPPMKLLLTVRDCSSLTSLSEKTILRLLQRGKIRCLAGIRHKRIPASEINRFIRENLS